MISKFFYKLSEIFPWLIILNVAVSIYQMVTGSIFMALIDGTVRFFMFFIPYFIFIIVYHKFSNSEHSKMVRKSWENDERIERDHRRAKQEEARIAMQNKKPIPQTRGLGSLGFGLISSVFGSITQSSSSGYHCPYCKREVSRPGYCGSDCHTRANGGY